MNRRALFGIVALVPAALNIAPVAAHAIAVPICSGDGVARSVNLPIPASPQPAQDGKGCCAKGCHTGSRKKSGSREIDTQQ